MDVGSSVVRVDVSGGVSVVDSSSVEFVLTVFVVHVSLAEVDVLSMPGGSEVVDNVTVDSVTTSEVVEEVSTVMGAMLVLGVESGPDVCWVVLIWPGDVSDDVGGCVVPGSGEEVWSDDSNVGASPAFEVPPIICSVVVCEKPLARAGWDPGEMKGAVPGVPSVEVDWNSLVMFSYPAV
jgi:hypothetical protein